MPNLKNKVTIKNKTRHPETSEMLTTDSSILDDSLQSTSYESINENNSKRDCQIIQSK